MLPCLALLLLMELSVCTVAGDGEVELSTKAETWITEGAGPSILLQLQEVKTGKASQFFGLMGKQVGVYQVEHTFQGLLGKRSLSTEGREDEAQGSE
ncbi:PREDICTED: tachykinin-4 isoform X3 [Colobus angolensis palliatus]|uniref:tachykinin-4 isoform X3 n=1 Tax=Colobus angolensis palliatus TaxID=336983 RepID=UPI0005F3F61D|nr:PREDICTED: tachykinin-4 isoform X3 [Colobus angolensis palliatus]